MSRLSFKWRRKTKNREVFLNLAQATEYAGAIREKIKGNDNERPGGNWLWPAIGFLVLVEMLLLGGHAIRWAKSSRHFELSKVVVVGHQALRPEGIIKLVGLDPGSNIFDANLEAVRARVASHPWIKRARVSMRPPHFLQVDILERKPAALITGDETLAVDEDGVVLGKPITPLAGCLPMIEEVSSRPLRPGDSVRDARFARSMEAVFLFHDSPVIRRSCISVRNTGSGELRLRALGGKVEIMVSEQRMESQAGRLRAVAGDVLRHEKFGAGGLLFDLRFPGRVIVRPLTEDGGSLG